jgi:hypothetical protein
MGRLAQARQRWGAQRPFQHHSLVGGGECRLHQLQRIGVGTHQLAQQAHLLLHERGVPARWMHGVDQDDISSQAGQKLAGVPEAQGHACDDGGEFRAGLACPRDAIGQERMDLGRPLEQRHLGTQRGQQESVPAETGGGVDDAERGGTGEARCPGQGLAAPATEAKPVADGTANEIDN